VGARSASFCVCMILERRSRASHGRVARSKPLVIYNYSTYNIDDEEETTVGADGKVRGGGSSRAQLQVRSFLGFQLQDEYRVIFDKSL
jgi:hypothetical protein